jgi:hypothetical protein
MEVELRARAKAAKTGVRPYTGKTGIPAVIRRFFIRPFWFNTPRLAAAQEIYRFHNLVLNQTIL